MFYGSSKHGINRMLIVKLNFSYGRVNININRFWVYFQKQKGELFAKSVKFKYPRQIKNVLVDSGSHQYKEVTEINRNLTLVIDELNKITKPTKVAEVDVKQKILSDLRHLEKVVSSKIAEIEADLEKLK